MSETNKEELKQPAQEDRAEKSTQETSATPVKNKPIWRYLGASSLYEFGRLPLGSAVFGSPVIVFPALSAGSESLAVEEDITQEELQAACIRLSEYINNNIADILRLREENDLLSEELRKAMVKLRSA